MNQKNITVGTIKDLIKETVKEAMNEWAQEQKLAEAISDFARWQTDHSSIKLKRSGGIK